MEQREDVLVVKSNKENFISSGIAAVLFALMGIIFPDGRMCIFWFTMALVVLRSCVVSNQMLILSKDGMTVKRKKITKYSWDELKLKRVNSYITILKKQFSYQNINVYKDREYLLGFINL